MKFIKSWKFMAIVLGVLFACAIVGVIVGVATHTEAGLMPNAPRWEQGDFPLTICAVQYSTGSLDTDGREAVADAADAINSRLGLWVYEVNDDGAGCEVMISLGVPQEPGWMDAGGDFRLLSSDNGLRCEVRTSNVRGELQGLVLQHELGHCLGLAHDDFELSIMRPVQTVTPDRHIPPWITDSDRELLRQLYSRP